MKKILITEKVLQELLYGSKKNKTLIANQFEDHLKKNDSFFVSILTVEEILKKEESIENRKIIFKNINELCDEIIEIKLDDSSSALRIETEYSTDHRTAMELTVASRKGIDCIYDTTDRFDFQKMISVIRLILKGE